MIGAWAAMSEEERAKLLAPEEWADKKPVDGPCYTVVGLPEDFTKWPELALPWRIAAAGKELSCIFDPPWAYSPSRAAERWARVRWDERYDGEGRLPITMRALVTHTDGRQWRVEIRIMRVVECFGRATPIEPDAHKTEGGAA